MNQKQIQLEIFDEAYKAKRANRTPIDSSKETVFKYKIPTQLCIKVASVIIAIVITFILGIERGKIISAKNIPLHYFRNSIKQDSIKNAILTENKIQKAIPVNTKKVETNTKTITHYAIDGINTTSDNKMTKKIEKGLKINNPEYIIQIVTYKKNSTYIKEEISKLKQKGFKPFTTASGDYMVICTGGFIDKTEAQAQLNKLKHTYKDCFIKKI